MFFLKFQMSNCHFVLICRFPIRASTKVKIVLMFRIKLERVNKCYSKVYYLHVLYITKIAHLSVDITKYLVCNHHSIVEQQTC